MAEWPCTCSNCTARITGREKYSQVSGIYPERDTHHSSHTHFPLQWGQDPSYLHHDPSLMGIPANRCLQRLISWPLQPRGKLRCCSASSRALVVEAEAKRSLSRRHTPEVTCSTLAHHHHSVWCVQACSLGQVMKRSLTMEWRNCRP